MSYLDALRKATRTQEVPYEISDRRGSEFIKSDIAQPSDRKKRAQEKYNRLSPSQKKQVDALLEARRSKNPQNALVRNQDARNEAQQKMMSRLDYINRQREMSRQEAETQAIEKQKRQIRLADAKEESAKARELAKQKLKEMAKQEKVQSSINKANVEFKNALTDFREADAVFEDSLNDNEERQEWLDNNMIDQVNEYSAWESEKDRRRQIHDRKQRVVLQKLVRNLMLANNNDVKAVAELLKEMGLGNRFKI